jgi:hypothetical protein
MKTYFYLPFVAVLTLASLSGCATYAPVQMANGTFSGRQVKSCIRNILFIEIDSNLNTRIDKTLVDNGLTSSDVFSIEKKSWYWTAPFYFYHCNLVSLNTEGAKKIPNAELIESYTHEDHPDSVAAEPVKSHPAQKRSVKIQLDDCDKLSPLARDRCREEVFGK